MGLIPQFIKNIMARRGIEIHRFHYIECDLTQDLKKVETKIPITIKRATPATLKKALPLIGQKTRDIISNNLHRDDVRLIAFAGSKIAGISCYSPNQVIMHNRIICETKGGAYGHSSYVLPEFRGKKIFQALIRAGYALQKEDGNSFGCNCVSVGNKPALGARLPFNVKTKQILVIFWGEKTFVIGKPIGVGSLL